VRSLGILAFYVSHCAEVGQSKSDNRHKMPSTTTGHVALLSTAWILPPQLCPSCGKKELARQRRSQKSIVRGVNFPAARRGMPVELIAIRLLQR